ncbi:TPA: (d)CMP kinase [Legionella pneumophila]|uniref:Cytidylate kinase n=1 Tax=Legionella pneumophila subsp. pneumophila TaxID=91891 RepID=A0AAV2UWD7_LEGPN|nr:(d)CMP kinase [Legionella pneumophila]ANH12785.1 cytidylate kinase [Legionella pneumophila]ANH15752.1 cytidylate kinase [Legionella pneumophila]ANH18718.1 cytidylate kinase [Legionella pneumophila]APX19605.1 cytidylate kinase [Legionella pneumophila]AQL11782.1 cytidylate kinase [Legionella pneumophila]
MVFNNEVPVITLDGPSGTGKGTICHLVAKRLHWNMLDSGAIYRVLAYAARKNSIEPNDIKKLTALARSLNLRFESSVDNETKVILDDENVSQQIRSEQCGQDASQIAVIPEVRAALLERQRNFAQFPGLVTDGRDMGTVVFPNAVLKVYLYASAEERANRRYLQLQDNGINVSLAQVVEELAKRDARDTARTHAPLKPAEDAVLIDTTGLTIVQVFNIVLKLIDERLNNL